MALYFPRNLTGANCTLGGQTLISWSSTEDGNSDFDTASAVCMAPGGAHSKGSNVQSIEGGTSTGYWCVENVIVMRSQRTWRKEVGGAFAHLPLVAYRLKRKGYIEARATISRAIVPLYPPRFCTQAYFTAYVNAGSRKMWAGEITGTQYYEMLQGLIPVSGPTELVRIVAGWTSLPVAFQTSLTFMPDLYQPVATTILACIKEVAGWSGASTRLDRNGTVQVYSWQSVYNSGASPRPAATTLEEELHDAIYPVTACTVVGTGRVGGGQGQWDFTNPLNPVWVPWDPTDSASVDGGITRGIEKTSAWSAFAGDQMVEERIEIGDYPITEDLAQSMANERMSRVVLEAGMARYQGPGEGSQAICPVVSRVFSVTRSLEWDGKDRIYRYSITIEAPNSDIVGAPATPPDPILDLGPRDSRRPFG